MGFNSTASCRSLPSFWKYSLFSMLYFSFFGSSYILFFSMIYHFIFLTYFYYMFGWSRSLVFFHGEKKKSTSSTRSWVRMSWSWRQKRERERKRRLSRHISSFIDLPSCDLAFWSVHWPMSVNKSNLPVSFHC